MCVFSSGRAVWWDSIPREYGWDRQDLLQPGLTNWGFCLNQRFPNILYLSSTLKVFKESSPMPSSHWGSNWKHDLIWSRRPAIGHLSWPEDHGLGLLVLYPAILLNYFWMLLVIQSYWTLTSFHFIQVSWVLLKAGTVTVSLNYNEFRESVTRTIDSGVDTATGFNLQRVDLVPTKFCKHHQTQAAENCFKLLGRHVIQVPWSVTSHMLPEHRNGVMTREEQIWSEISM